jgi:SAM-dependent methyltransferase
MTNTSEWFKDWFDTSFYHLLYNHRDFTEAESFIQNLVKHLGVNVSSKVIDIGCGKGRHAKFLLQFGFEVLGIDLSAESIASANQFSNTKLSFKQADMRNVYANEKFDLAVNLFSSFGYFEDDNEDKKVLSNMRTALKQGGTLVLDYMNPEKIIKEMKIRDIVDKGEIQFHISKKIENSFIVKDIRFLADAQDFHFQERLKVIKPSQFKTMFIDTGFEVISLFGDYQLGSFDPKNSLRQIWVVKKV